MKKLLFSVLFSAALFIFIGCGSSTVDLPKTDVGDIPEWFLNPPTDPNYLYAVSTETSRDLQMAVDKATTSARTDISRQVEIKVSGLEKQFKEEIGVAEDSQLLQQFTQASKTVTNQSLTGSKVKEKKIIKDGNTFRAYILVEYPIGAANVALMDALKKQNELYTRFRSSQTFEELNKEIENYNKK